MSLRYGSVCSGIEAASVAWHPLGFVPAFFSEIEKFPSRVLAHHYGSNMPGEPHATNGVPNYGDMTKFREWPDAAIDVLVGGTPCQSFSIAGLRAGLDDPRGNLALTFLALAERYRPRWIVWENVPGVLSSNGGGDFAAFLGGLSGIGYGWAYRVLDAQFIRVDGYARAVPQRRRRVFVVGYSGGDWRRAAAVLFEPESMRGDSPPRREAGQGVAPTIAARTRGGGGLGTDFDCDGGLIASTGDISHCLNASFGDKQGLEDQHINQGAPLFVAHALRAEGFDASEDGTGRGTPLVPIAFAIQERAVSENPASGPDGVGVQADISYTLEARTQVQGVAHPYTLAIRGRGESHDLEYRQDGTANAVLTPNGGRAGIGVGAIAHEWAVRRLTPRECERLQGFPDDYTNITGPRSSSAKRGSANKEASDGPRYKALGNSMAVNVMRWIGMRLQIADAVFNELDQKMGAA